VTNLYNTGINKCIRAHYNRKFTNSFSLGNKIENLSDTNLNL